MASINLWPVEEKPIKRLATVGVQGLSDSELLSFLFGSGKKGNNAVETARGVITQAGGLIKIQHMDLEELKQFYGIGSVVAARIVSAVELGRRIGERRQTPLKRIKSSRDIYELYRHRLIPLLQEVFMVVVIDNRHRPIKEVCVAKGGLCSCSVEPREVFRPAVVSGGAKVILMHNHPSGDPEPSKEDVEISRRLTEAGMILGVEVLDHLVIASEGYSSLRDLGLLEKNSKAFTVFRHLNGKTA